jgi:hypothetical protein
MVTQFKKSGDMVKQVKMTGKAEPGSCKANNPRPIVLKTYFLCTVFPFPMKGLGILLSFGSLALCVWGPEFNPQKCQKLKKKKNHTYISEIFLDRISSWKLKSKEYLTSFYFINATDLYMSTYVYRNMGKLNMDIQ